MNTNLNMALAMRWFNSEFLRGRLYEAYGYMTEARAGWAMEAKRHGETRDRLKSRMSLGERIVILGDEVVGGQLDESGIFLCKSRGMSDCMWVWTPKFGSHKVLKAGWRPTGRSDESKACTIIGLARLYEESWIHVDAQGL